MKAQLKFEDLDRKTLELLIQVKYARLAAQEEDAIKRLLEQSIVLEGKKGRGKSVSSVMISHRLREVCGRHVITVGTKLGLQPAFGDFKEITEGQFKDALSKVQEVVDENTAAECVWQALKDKGVDLLYSTIIFDEAYKLFDARNPMDKMTRVFGYFMAQQRHYHCTTILCAPTREMIDKRVRQQVDWFGRCFHNKWTHQCVARMVSGLETLPLSFNCIDDSLHPAYYEMYDSWYLTDIGKRHLAMRKSN